MMEARAARIMRSRTGCLTCRRRKKKCDERKATCGGCKRNRLDCTWPPDSASPRPRGKAVSPVSASAVPAPKVRSNDSYELALLNFKYEAATIVADFPPSPESPSTDPQAVDRPGFCIDTQLDIPAQLSMLPSRTHDSYQLFSYYLSRTANSMGNGTTQLNPFIEKLVPLAFTSPLLLQLVLAQSAAHRQASGEPAVYKEMAQVYYTDSLRMFSHAVGQHVAGKHQDVLILTVGSLIMCLTEVARGDKCGSTFRHIAASKSLLTTLLESRTSRLCNGLADFLVEYYVHMAAASIISADPSAEQPLLSPEIESLARGLLEKNYVGQLCGSWLWLLLLIPQISALGQRMLSTSNGQPAADDIIHFGLLQSQVLAFSPDPSVGPNTYLAGLVFKQAVLLYLWSLLGTPHRNPANDAHRQLMGSAVAEAVALLGQFPASARVNTSLCWPLAVIGCCTADPAVQDIVRLRLKVMLETIGLGNMRETLALLEHVWTQPAQETSPWTLRRSMREHQTWISFA